MRIAWLIPVRNKERFVGRAIESALRQTLPLDMIVSDQGSTDRSLDAIRAALEVGPETKKSILLHCPEGGEYGMEGLNRNLNWAIANTDYDAYLILSADDTVEPSCANLMVRALEEDKADAVGGLFAFVDPEGKDPPTQPVFPTESRFVTSAEHLFHSIGGSSFRGLTRSLAEWRPLQGDAICDVWWPYWACTRLGYYCVADPITGLHWKHKDSRNAGIEGRKRAATTDLEVTELNLRQWLEIMRTWARILRAGDADKSPDWTWKDEDRNIAMTAMLNHGLGYTYCWDEIRRMAEATTSAA